MKKPCAGCTGKKTFTKAAAPKPKPPAPRVFKRQSP